MAQQPDPYKRLSTEFAKLREDVRRLQNRSPFFNTGISLVAPGEFEIDGTVTVTGDFIAQGKISNDALVNPIRTAATSGGAVDVPFTTTPTLIWHEDLTVPTGFTKALVVCHVWAGGFNANATADYLLVQGAVNGATGGSAVSQGDAGGYGAAAAVRTSQLSGLSAGATVTCEVWVHTVNYTWAADASNGVLVNAYAFWTR